MASEKKEKNIFNEKQFPSLKSTREKLKILSEKIPKQVHF